MNGAVFKAKSSENYDCVKTGCLKFLDSFRSLGASLESLSTTLSPLPTLAVDGIDEEFFQ